MNLLSLTPHRVSPGETLHIEFTTNRKKDWDFLYFVLKNKRHTFPKRDSTIRKLVEIKPNCYAFQFNIPTTPLNTPDGGIYLVQIWAKQKDTNLLLVEKPCTIVYQKNVFPKQYLQLIPKPKTFFFDGRGVSIPIQNEIISISLVQQKLDEIWIQKSLQELIQPYQIKFTQESLLQINVSSLPSTTSTEIKKEGYYVSITQVKINQTICRIQANSTVGFLNALRTVAQLLYFKKDIVHVPIVEIKDAPSFNIRGIVEGFYGKPWGLDQKIDFIKYIGYLKMNTFLYAPKDDPYHRDKWQLPYPKKEEQQIQTLIEETKKQGIDFIFSVSPGNSIQYTKSEDINQLAEKLIHFGKLGIQHFALLMDDIEEKLQYQQDIQMYQQRIGKAHAELANILWKKLTQKFGKKIQFIFCPMEYFQQNNSIYRTDIKEYMNSSIQVIWTGSGIFSSIISSKNPKKQKEIFGHSLLLWDNFPVNDADSSTLFLGPITNRDPKLYRYCEGVIANPMVQAELSKVSIGTISDYLWNTKGYEAKTSWENSILKFAGSQYAKPFQMFASTFLGSRIFFNSNIELKELWETWFVENKANDPNSCQMLIDHLNTLLKAILHLKKWKNTNFQKEAKPFLRELEHEISHLLQCINCTQNKTNVVITLDETKLNPLHYFVCNGLLLEYIDLLQKKEKNEP